MTGICGWLNSSVQVGDIESVLTKMSNHLGGEVILKNISPPAAMAAYSPFSAASLVFEQGIITAVDGRISWSNAEYASIAQRSSHAAALLQAYRQHGKNCLRFTQGAFTLAIIDITKNSVLLAIDRIGIQRLCFAKTAQGIVFGSIADSVTTHPDVGRKISSQGVFNYLYHHMVPAPGTIYQQVEKLLPAQYVWFENGKITRDFYWSADWSVNTSLDFATYQKTLKQLLQDSVGRQLDQKKTGAFLSGGTDSSTVAGMLTKVSGKPAETFSIGFDAEGFDEMEYARIAVKHFGTNPHEYYVTPDDVVQAVPLIAAAYDEPFGNASAMPTYFCALKGKQAGVDVMLAGDGGDEIFGGNERYAKQKIFEVYGQVPALFRHILVEPVASVFSAVPKLGKLHSYVRQARVPLPDRLETYNFLHNTALDKIFTPEFLRDVHPEQPLQTMREVFNRTQSDHFVNKMLHLDWKQTLADNDLRKVNRMCELAGMEVRYPLLDDEMIAFSATLPIDYKVKGAQLRWFFKEALRDFLPHEIITKSKHGFGLPFGVWMRQHEPLRTLAYDSLHAFRNRGLIQTSYIDELEKQHQGVHASYYGVMIWVIMMLEQWLQHHE